MTKKKASITRRTIGITVLSSALLAVVALVLGMYVFGSGLIDQYVTRSCEIASYSQLALKNSADPVDISHQVMDIYRSLTPEQRESDDYLKYYSGIDTSLTSGGNYDKIFHLLRRYTIDVDDVYLAMYDRDTSALVYIVDSDMRAERRLQLGEWEPVTERECELFLNCDNDKVIYDISDTDKYGWMCSAGFPVTDGNGEICAFVLVDVMLDSILMMMLKYALKIFLALLAATILITRFVSSLMRIMVSEPINQIARAAESYVEDKKEGIEREHFTNIGKDSGYEIVNLAAVMADMERDIAEHERYITKITAEEERINTELQMASKIQEAMLPSVFPPYPDRNEFEIYATMEPAKKVGGDFYDFYLIDDDHLCVVIADVAGKGIPAALFMMNSMTIIRSFAGMGQTAAEILRNTNEVICSNNDTQMFVSVWAGILELSTGRLIAANAGHEYPAMMRDGKFTLLKDHHDLVVGAMEGIDYKDYELDLQPGDKLFVYSDGLPEAADTDNNMLGTDRMIDVLNNDPAASPEQLIRNVRSAVNEFVKDAEQFDDLTMLCLEYRGKQ